ncbi:MAG: toll/interleukin-1 receptor domain-containing protein [Thiolinea sp.]
MIFLSYSWQDQAAIKIVENALKRIGLKYWIDREHLDLSNQLHSQIVLAIHNSSQILALKSEDSTLSPWVCFELGVASKLGKKISELDSDHEYLNHSCDSYVDKLLLSLLFFNTSNDDCHP